MSEGSTVGHETEGSARSERWWRAGPQGSRLGYDPVGGGFAHWHDPDGRDWVAFGAEPLAEFPASAAAGYRGLGNLVHGGPWGGAGHPGFSRCRSECRGAGALAVETIDGAWAWDWRVEAECVRLTMRRTPDGEGGAGEAWWFLYEGPVAGRFAPAQDVWGDERGIGAASGAAKAGIADQPFLPRRWVWLGATGYRWALWLGLRAPAGAEVPLSTLWWLGSEAQGRWQESRDGMVVFGFGRGPGTKPLLRGAGWEVVATWLCGAGPAQWQAQAEAAARRWLVTS